VPAALLPFIIVITGLHLGEKMLLLPKLGLIGWMIAWTGLIIAHLRRESIAPGAFGNS